MNRRLKLTALAAGMALLTGGIVYAAIPADAATADVQFSRIDYDPAGTDNRSNTSLVAEYVRVTNRSPFTANLNKWTLTDAQGHKFTFPNHNVGAHKTVYIHTGRGTNGFYPAGRPDSPHLYWNSGNYIWNNTGDTATLRSASGRIYDVCSWKTGGIRSSCNFTAPDPLPVKGPPPSSTTPRPTKSAIESIPPPFTTPPTPPKELPSENNDCTDPVDCTPLGG